MHLYEYSTGGHIASGPTRKAMATRRRRGNRYTREQDTVMWRLMFKLKATFESGSPHSSFKR